MNTPPKNSTKRTLPSAEAAAQARRGQIKAMVKDNDERLWYITKFGTSKFPTDKLKTLIEIRRGFQNNPNYQLSAEREVQYREATMAASEFLEDRHPEAIRLYAQVQNKEKSNPLNLWLLGIGIALVFALASNGYQTLIGNQVQRMKETRAKYIEEASRLPLSDTDLPASLSRMCEQTLIYRAAAAQLRALLHPFASERSGLSNGESVADRPGVCNVIAQLKSKSIVETGGADAQVRENGKVVDAVLTIAQPKSTSPVETGGTDAQVRENGNIIDAAISEEFAPLEDRAVRLEAELYDSILAVAIMPMLYALLGALTSAVRTANSEFKSMTLTRNDAVSLRARVLLGVVGGATIGIVFSADTLEGAAGLTVLGLAFAVGYAVDLFFNLLDGVKLGLGGSAKPSPQSR